MKLLNKYKISLLRNDKMKGCISLLMIIVGVLSIGNTNNNPVPFIDRVFRPIRFGNGGVLFLSGFIIIILIYNGVKGLGRYWGNKLSFFHKHPIIITIIIIMLIPNVTLNNIKIYKSLSRGLNSIYCYREEKYLRLNITEEGIAQLNGMIKLKNYSSKPRKFYIKLHIPEFMGKYISEKEFSATTEDNHTIREFTLEGGEEKIIDTVFICEKSYYKLGQNIGSGTKYFEFELYNESEEVKFIEETKGYISFDKM